MSALAARQRYLADQVSTATPAALIVMLYDRLGRDIELAATAQGENESLLAAGALLHAQQIVAELLTSLDLSVWSGGEDLARIYQYLLIGLIEVRSTPSPDRLRAMGVLVDQLRSAWQGAASELVSARSATSSVDRSVASLVRVG